MNDILSSEELTPTLLVYLEQRRLEPVPPGSERGDRLGPLRVGHRAVEIVRGPGRAKHHHLVLGRDHTECDDQVAALDLNLDRPDRCSVIGRASECASVRVREWA